MHEPSATKEVVSKFSSKPAVPMLELVLATGRSPSSQAPLPQTGTGTTPKTANFALLPAAAAAAPNKYSTCTARIC